MSKLTLWVFENRLNTCQSWPYGFLKTAWTHVKVDPMGFWKPPEHMSKLTRWVFENRLNTCQSWPDGFLKTAWTHVKVDPMGFWKPNPKRFSVFRTLLTLRLSSVQFSRLDLRCCCLILYPFINTWPASYITEHVKYLFTRYVKVTFFVFNLII